MEPGQLLLGAALCDSHLWPEFQILKLTVNMRVERLIAAGRDASEQTSFSDFLLIVGEGKAGDSLQIPSSMLEPGADCRNLINWVYGDLQSDASLRTPECLIQKAILTPKNDGRRTTSTQTTWWFVARRAWAVC